MTRSLALAALLLSLTACGARQPAAAPPTTPAATTETVPRDAPAPGAAAALEPNADGKVELSDEEWRQRLTPEQYRILREKGTERAFTGEYWDTKTSGTYACRGCGEVLFSSGTKYDSGCGWPSFYEPAADGLIDEHEDTSFGMIRPEVTCSRCGGHLGHVFPDGPQPTGLRYCINSASIELRPEEEAEPTDDGL
jgi:peptide-methionine (R)-S-oxide reductase